MYFDFESFWFIFICIIHAHLHTQSPNPLHLPPTLNPLKLWYEYSLPYSFTCKKIPIKTKHEINFTYFNIFLVKMQNSHFYHLMVSLSGGSRSLTRYNVCKLCIRPLLNSEFCSIKVCVQPNSRYDHMTC